MGPGDPMGLPLLGARRSPPQVSQCRVSRVVVAVLFSLLHADLRLEPGGCEHPHRFDGAGIGIQIRSPCFRAEGAVVHRGPVRLETQLGLAMHQGGPAEDPAAHVRNAGCAGCGSLRGPGAGSLRRPELPGAIEVLAEVPRPHRQGHCRRLDGRVNDRARLGPLQREVSGHTELPTEGVGGRVCGVRLRERPPCCTQIKRNLHW
mmetsp:Transcript_105976/g.306511  ORF Transcript_105976/g.306511 Transcript_105976/m.306511 type:complete len:204 (-) Transcript_105976:487-1098(-)